MVANLIGSSTKIGDVSACINDRKELASSTKTTPNKNFEF